MTESLTITFTVPAVPVAQPRQRVAIRGAHAVNYTPTKHPVNDFKATVRMAAAQVFTGAPLTCPIAVTLMFYLPRPKRLIWKTRPMPRLPHASKPDLDNLAKSVFDALTGLVWVDDSQIARSHLVKDYAAGDQSPHVVVSVERVDDASETLWSGAA